jgi:HEAT repeat protein
LENKNFLQSIKIEISKNIKLLPYERLAFHQILSKSQTLNGIQILTQELSKEGVIRLSAFQALSKFNDPKVTEILESFLNKDITIPEKIIILDHINEFGTENNSDSIIELIQNNKNNKEIIFTSLITLKNIYHESEKIKNFLISIVKSNEYIDEIKGKSIIALSFHKDITLFENFLKINNDTISYSVYIALSDLLNKIIEDMSKDRTDKDYIFTYLPHQDDEHVLDIRVLLGKMTPKFDSYSYATKISFVNTMVICNHREYLMYLMKILTDKDPDNVKTMLETLYTNIIKLRSPDKLFRNLIALTTDSELLDDLIPDIFIKYFNGVIKNRDYNILKNKLFGYITVTLETYFQTYRKEFLITDVMEDHFSEEFQITRSFILRLLNSNAKKKIIEFLSQEDKVLLKSLFNDLSKSISYIDDKDKNELNTMINLLYRSEEKTRKEAITNIESINFEKKYLKKRIIRLCRLIAKLNIVDAASPLVNTYNYLKKYREEELIDNVMKTLSILNYSYMLGEIEVFISTGNETDQTKGLELIKFYSDQRSNNIIIEFLMNNYKSNNKNLLLALEILLNKDISQNMSVNQIMKNIIKDNDNTDIRTLALNVLGKCHILDDIDLLNQLFLNENNNLIKNSIIKAILEIILNNKDFKKRQIIKYLLEFLKDPNIKTRIYSLLLLIKLGNSDAFRTIREMLVIKNKDIQRELLLLLSFLNSLDLSFFLISLLKEEYGISKDIISIINKLPEKDLHEIDAFIVNIFRKHIAPSIEEDEKKPDEKIIINNLNKKNVTILFIKIFNLKSKIINLSDHINLSLNIKELLNDKIVNNNGTIEKSSANNLIGVFKNSNDAVIATNLILKDIKSYNSSNQDKYKINISTRLISGDFNFIQDELILHQNIFIISEPEILNNKILIQNDLKKSIENDFVIKNISDLIFTNIISNFNYSQIISLNNFINLSDKLLKAIKDKILEEESLKDEEEIKLKKIKHGQRSVSSIEIAKELETIGNSLEIQLKAIETYIFTEATNIEVKKVVKRMINNTISLYRVEISRLTVD